MHKGWRIALQLFDDIDRAVLTFEPVLKEGLGCFPKIELRVKLASQAFNIEQSFAIARVGAGLSCRKRMRP